MITAVDTSVLLDLFVDDPRFAVLSGRALRSCTAQGTLVACELVWAELASFFPSAEAVRAAMDLAGVAFSSIEQATAVAAGRVMRAYRGAGGKRERMVADFLIGAHALLQTQRLLTRDRGFYRAYFSDLEVLDPSTSQGQ